jgi:hypothetical protein
MEELLMVIHILAESQPLLIQLELQDQMSFLEDKVDTVTGAIKHM